MQLLRWTLWSAIAASGATVALLLIRRWGGADLQPLRSAGLVLLGVAVSAAAGCAHVAWRWSVAMAPSATPHGGYCFDGCVTLTVASLGAAISLPGSPAVALGLFWTLLAGTELVSWWGMVRRRERPRTVAAGERGGARPPEPATAPLPERAAPAEEPTALEDAADGWEMLPANTWQRMARAVDETGQEIVYGAVRCDFAIGQRQQNVHLAFCPPLGHIPELSTEQTEGPSAKVQASLVETFGVCLEVRLPAPSTEPTSVQIQFYASAPPTS
jgi:hypothetical protein